MPLLLCNSFFIDGHVGASLLSINSFPAEAFPDDGSAWNQFANMTEDVG
jgi:hypothetical protein